MLSINIKGMLPKSTPQEFVRIVQDSFDGKSQIESYPDKNAIDKAIHQGRNFIFRCVVDADDYSTLKFGKYGLILIGILFILLLIFGDFMDPLFLIVGLAPLFMMSIIAYGYFNNGRNRVKGKPTWFLVLGAKGFLIKNVEYLEYFEWIQIVKIAERSKFHHHVKTDILGVELIARQQQYSIDFNVFDLKSISAEDSTGKLGRENLLYIIQKYKERPMK